MGTIQEQLERLRQFNARIGVDIEMGSAAPAPASDEEALVQESIIMRSERPVLAVKRNKAELIFRDEIDARIWQPVSSERGSISSAQSKPSAG